VKVGFLEDRSPGSLSRCKVSTSRSVIFDLSLVWSSPSEPLLPILQEPPDLEHRSEQDFVLAGEPSVDR
jgi:hypothetical protein